MPRSHVNVFIFNRQMRAITSTLAPLGPPGVHYGNYPETPEQRCARYLVATLRSSITNARARPYSIGNNRSMCLRNRV